MPEGPANGHHSDSEDTPVVQLSSGEPKRSANSFRRGPSDQRGRQNKREREKEYLRHEQELYLKEQLAKQEVVEKEIEAEVALEEQTTYHVECAGGELRRPEVAVASSKY